MNESSENYLETILILSNRKPHVRSIDIANELDFSKPSVSVAMRNLRENGYILVDQDGYLGVDEKTAAEDACRIEHVVSAKSFQAIKDHVTKGNELLEK